MDRYSEQTTLLKLLQKYLSGELQVDEYARLQEWADEHPAYREVLDRISSQDRFRADLKEFHNLSINERRTIAYVIAKQAISEVSMETSGIKSINTFRRWLPYVAAILSFFVIGVGMYWYLNSDQPIEILHSKAVVDIPPGGNRAVLTLANGRVIDLNEGQVGIMMGDEIRYFDGTGVLGEPASPETEEQIHSLATPKGGTYQITLSDGTKVWLNAASTLKYPSRFDGKERVVELSGEAYFSVAKDKKRPFRVVNSGQEIKVLGTEFNVSVYDDEPEAKTTLVEGSVSIVSVADRLSPQTLRPGEQATLRGTAITVQGVDVAAYTAWKDGRFYFRNTSFEEMMVQISRWYDVKVVYRREVPKETFSGNMSRNLSLMTVLELLNVSAVSIRLEKNSLIVE